MPDEFKLSDKDRTKLDGIVGEMSSAGESDDNITFVVNDFKSKYGLKKKDETFSEDSEIPASKDGKPSEKSGAEQLFKDIAKGEKEEKKDVSRNYDIFKDEAVNSIQDFQRQIKETTPFIEDQAFDPNRMEDGTYISTTDRHAPIINPDYKKIQDKRAVTLSNARKAFKSNYIQDNPEIIEKLESGDAEKVEAAHKEIYNEWTKEPEILAGSDRTIQDRSMLEQMYYSFKAGMDERDFNQAMAQELAYADEDEAKKILELEYERSVSESQDINRPEAALGSAEGISKMVGTQAVPIATTIGISLIPGAQPAAVMYASGDAATTSYGAAFRSSYIQARNEGSSELEAYDIAKTQAKVEGATGAVEGAVGAFTGGAATRLGKKFTQKFSSKLLAPIVEKAAVGVTDAGFDAGAAAIGQVINNSAAIAQGLNTGLFDGVQDEMLGELIFSAGMKVPGTVTTVADYRKYVRELPAKEQQQIFDKIVDSKQDLESKIALEKTNSYLDLKGQEALQDDNTALSARIKLNPEEVLLEEKARMQTIQGSLKSDKAQEEVGKNIDALDLMIGSLNAFTVTKGDTKQSLDKKSMEENVKDDAFIKKVAEGEIDVTIKDSPELQLELKTKVDEYNAKTKKDDSEKQEGVSSEKQKGKEPVKTKPVKEDGKGKAETSGVLQESREVTPESKRQFAIDAVMADQVSERKKGAILPREDLGMNAKEINKAISDIKKGKHETAPAKKLIKKLGEAYEAGNIPIIKGTGGITVRDEGIPISEIEKGIKEHKTKPKEEVKQDEPSDSMKEWLDDGDDFKGANIFDNANISTKIVEWKGDKMPENAIKKSIKTLRENVESGVNKSESITNALEDMKTTDWYKGLSESKQKAFDQDFRKSLGDDMKSSEKVKTEDPFVRKRERTILKEKIENLSKGAKLGAKAKETSLKAVKKGLVNYVDNVLKEFPITKAKQKQIGNMIATANTKNVAKILEKVDKIVSVQQEATRKRTVRNVKDILGNRKSILKKVGSKWKARVPVDVIQYIKGFDATNLDNLSLEGIRQVEADLNSILKEGKQDKKAVEKARKRQRELKKGDVFEAFFQGNKETVSGLENLQDKFDENKNYSMVIDGHLINSKSALNDYVKDNPDSSLENITVVKTKTAKIQAEKKHQSVIEFFKDLKSPFGGAKNLMNNALSMAKAGKKGLSIAREIANDGMANEVEYNKEVSKITKKHIDNINDIFLKDSKFKGPLKSRYAAKRLSVLAKLSMEDSNKIQDGIGEHIVMTNDRLVNWYNINKTAEGKETLKKMGVDMDIVNNYIESNQDLKDFAGYLVDDFYPSLKDRYEPTYEHLTGQKFDEGLYYPAYKVSPLSELTALESIVDQTGNVNSALSIAGSLKQRINNVADIDLTKGAFDVSTDYVKSMERSKVFIPYAENIDDIFNKQAVPEIINQIGYDQYKDLIDHISTVIKGVSPRASAKMDKKWINGIMKIKIFASLSGKFASIPKQLTSATRFMVAEDISMDEFLRGAPINKNEFEMMSKVMSSDYVKDRFNGMGYDLEAAKLVDTGAFSTIGDYAKTASKILMSPVSVGDIAGVLAGGVPYSIAAYRQEIKNGLSHEQAMEKSLNRFIDVSESTQQSSLKAQTSHIQRSDFGRLFSMYTTSQKQGINQIMTAVKELKYDKDLTTKEKAKKVNKIAYYAVENMLFAAVANGFIYAVYKSFTDESDDEEFNKGLYDTAMDNIQSLLAGTGYSGYILNMIVNTLRDNEWKNELAVYQELQNLSGSAAMGLGLLLGEKGVDDLSDAEEKKLMKGLPIDGILRQAKDFMKAAEGEKTMGEALMGWKSEEEKKSFKPKKDKIYKALFKEPYAKKNLSPLEQRKQKVKSSPKYLQAKKKKEALKKRKEELGLK